MHSNSRTRYEGNDQATPWAPAMLDVFSHQARREREVLSEPSAHRRRGFLPRVGNDHGMALPGLDIRTRPLHLTGEPRR